VQSSGRINLVLMRSILFLTLGALLTACQPQEQSASPTATMNTNKPTSSNSTNTPRVVKSNEEWRQQLTPQQYRVLRQAGTEPAFGEAYQEFKHQGEGTYVCGGCGAELFSSKEKFDSECGWPSFYDPANAKNVIARDDISHGMRRTEVLCAVCGGHLGHVFKGEGFPTPTDLRYCINGVALKFVPKAKK
jgi:peptide-methionine (R)-S-oxide reductase